jgi:DNA-binding SARP family transcriptional activator
VVLGTFCSVTARSEAADLKIAVLGPLEAWHQGTPVAMGGDQQRALFALLALHTGTGMRRDEIIEALWPTGPPQTAVAIVQTYVSRLRRALGQGRPACDADGVLITRGTGYRLRLGAGQLDLLAVTRLAERARNALAEGDLTTACGAFDDALGRWRGEPLADIELLQPHPALAELRRLWSDMVMDYADTSSALGWHARVLPYLRALTQREPLDERAHACLMIALAGTGQQAAALQAYAEIRERLSDQLGIDPGAELAEAHARVLRQDIRWTARPLHSSDPPRADDEDPPERALPGLPCWRAAPRCSRCGSRISRVARGPR